MRDDLDGNRIVTGARFVLKFLAARLETDKPGARKAMFGFSPYGYLQTGLQDCRNAPATRLQHRLMGNGPTLGSERNDRAACLDHL